MTEAFLRDFLVKPHGQARALSAMPGFLMPSYHADVAIAYLMSLTSRGSSQPRESRITPVVLRLS